MAVDSSIPGQPVITQDGAPAVQHLSTLFDADNTSLPVFFNAIFSAAIAVGAILAVVRLGYAGTLYMMTDLVSTKQNARAMISQVVLGLLLLLGVWVILKQINPDILNLDILRSASS